MKARLLAVLLLTALGCASSHRGVATERMPGLEGEPAGVGYFPLPQGLAVDPKTLPIQPLDFSVVKPERVTLENGLTVYFAEDRAAPLVTIRALVANGSYDDPQDKLGLANLTFDLMTSGGAGALDADALDELFEFHAADVGGGAGDEFSSVNISMRSQDLQTLFPRFVDVLLRPRFQKDRFDVAVNRFVEAVRRRPDNPADLASRAMRKAIHGPDSVFGREAVERTLRAVRVADLQAFHRRAVVPRGTRLLVSGDFDKDAMRALIQASLGSWKGEPPRPRTFPASAPLKRRVFVVPKPLAQSKIRIGGHGYQRLSPQEYSMRVVGTALGSFGVGRLYREVRDTQGLAYSAFAMVAPGPTTGMFLAGADTRPETAAKAIEASLNIIGEITGPKPISQQEISIASDMFLNSFAFRFDSAEKIVREKAIFDLQGYPDDYLDNYRRNIAAVNPQSALEAAKTIGQLDALQIVVVGPPDKMGDLSRFGPVTVIHDVEAFR